MGSKNDQPGHVPGLQKPEVEDKEMSMAMFDKMPFEEQSELLKHEKIIRDGKETFIKVGVALAVIQGKKLYRKDYENFSDYCEKKWGFTRQYAHDLIKGAAAVQALPKDLSSVVDKPKAAAALAKVPQEDQASVVDVIKKSGKPATAAVIIQTAAEVAKPKVEKSERPKLRCETGCVIPTDLEELWSRRSEVKGMMAAVSEVKCQVESLFKKKDPLVSEVSNLIIAQFGQVYEGLKYALPYAVCSCNGRNREACLVCHGRGLISEVKYKTLKPEFREMRAKIKVQSGK